MPGNLLHRGELLGACGALMRGLPGLIGHAVDSFAALVLAHRHALGVGRFLEPVRQAVAAEAGEVHQLDILHVSPRAKVLDQAAEHRGLQLRSGFVVARHGHDLAVAAGYWYRWSIVTE